MLRGLPCQLQKTINAQDKNYVTIIKNLEHYMITYISNATIGNQAKSRHVKSYTAITSHD
jgi:hypothetical protein